MSSITETNMARQTMLRNMMDVIANNIANMSTPGFKAQNLAFSAHLDQAGGDGATAVSKGATGYRDLSQGVLTPTFSKFDFAIQGDGYFVVETPEGRRYTRAGAFALNDKREVVTKTGYPVLSDGDSPLVVPPGVSEIAAAADGSVSSEKGPIGRFKLVRFENPQAPMPVGGNLLDAGDAEELPAEEAKVSQGMLENSNVEPIFEMNRMIEVLRMYQSTQNIASTDHDTIRNMIQKLTKV